MTGASRSSLNFMPLNTGPVLSGTMENTAEARRRKRLNVYIDESGDRNSKDNRQSDYFTMTAVLIEVEHDHQLRMQIEGAQVIGGVKWWKQ